MQGLHLALGVLLGPAASLLSLRHGLLYDGRALRGCPLCCRFHLLHLHMQQLCFARSRQHRRLASSQNRHRLDWKACHSSGDGRARPSYPLFCRLHRSEGKAHVTWQVGMGKVGSRGSPWARPAGA